MSNGEIVRASDFRQYLGANMRAIEAAIRTKMKPATVCTMLMQQRSDPHLARCTPESFLRSALQCLQLGLEPNNVLGHAYLVPYKGECTLQIGYKGMIQLAYRSGRIRSIHSRCVYANESYAIDWAQEPPISHTPLPPSQRGDFVAAYCVIETTSGGRIYDWMWDEEIELIRQKSPAKEKGPWKTHTDEMRRKTVTKRGLKYSPSEPDSDMDKAVAIDDRTEVGLAPNLDFIDVKPYGSLPAARAQGLDDLVDGDIDSEPATEPKPEPEPEPEPKPEPAKKGEKKSKAKAESKAGANRCPRCNQPDGKHIKNCPNEKPTDPAIEDEPHNETTASMIHPEAEEGPDIGKQGELPLTAPPLKTRAQSETPPVNQSALDAHAAVKTDKLRDRRLKDIRNAWAKLAHVRRESLLEEMGLDDVAEVVELDVKLLGRFLDLLNSGLREQQEEAELADDE